VRIGEWGNTDTTLTAGIESGIEYAGSAGTAAVNLGNKARADIFRNALAKAPFAALAPPGVIKAGASAVVSNGEVAYIIVTNPGAGYTGEPAVSFSGEGGGRAYAVADVVDGRVVSVTVTNHGSGYTSAPAVTISGLSLADIEAKNSSIYLKTDPTVTTTYRTAMSGTPVTAWTSNGWSASLMSHAVGTSPIGSACNTNGSGGAAAEVLVDPETGAVEVTGLWNCVDTGRTIFRKGVLKDLLGGCELMMAQLLFYGNVLDPKTGAILNTQLSDMQFPTALDMKDVFSVSDVESDDAAGPFGTHGDIFSASSNVSAIYCAIYNAIGVFPDTDGGALTPDKTLQALGKA
jgi:CO/xanthine dehydrogenase Mo-binding subunit